MTKAEDEKSRFVEALDKAANEGCAISFFWRDDDATEPTDELDRLLALFAEEELPLGLAVIPEPASPELAERLKHLPGVAVLQHGLAHRDHSHEGEKKSEFPASRDLRRCLTDIELGRERLHALFSSPLPVFVPPWNNIADAVAEALPSLGIFGLSRLGRSRGLAGERNAHLDVIEWRTTRAFIGREVAWRCLADEAQKRLAGEEGPIGILTHHLAHDDGCWDFSAELVELLCDHRGAAMPPVADIFGLATSGGGGD
ncbi:polysaccharide deacetylase family protein [Afifella sp. IM 167]|uniref:polysaccharide deacetylase family protein n=1 Tax=Afifella sp. IM 167 TaxID=2033586 RepID=UPI001CCA2AA6|nr:polysaccharide deacetylase family protein [Afifella sp. IM 167]